MARIALNVEKRMFSFSAYLTRYLVLFAALLMPFGTLLLYPRLISWDITSFRFWADCLSQLNNPHAECYPERINYPTLGLYASGGVVQFLGALGLPRPEVSRVFQLYLGVIDALNLILMYLLLRGLKVPSAWWATLVFALLPSTRVGGSLWGQIDGVSQFFLSLGFLCGLRALMAVEREQLRKAQRYFAALSLSIACALLTKQLVVFSLPALGVMWLAVGNKLCSQGRARQIISIGVLVAIIAVALDQLFPTPPGYFGSGVLYVLKTGSTHADRILHNGTSIFALLPLKDMNPSKAAYPLFSMANLHVSILPFYFGLALFSLASLTIVSCGIASFRARINISSLNITIFCLIMGAALNLFMNTALTGTHERYLYHYGFFAYPFILLFARRFRFPRTLIVATIVHLSIYGAFVYHILMEYYEAPMTIFLQQATAYGNVLFSIFYLYAAAAWSRAARQPR